MSWGGWLLVTSLVFSLMAGTIHPYYTAALAPAVGALVGLGSVWAWRSRAAWDGRLAMVGHGRASAPGGRRWCCARTTSARTGCRQPSRRWLAPSASGILRRSAPADAAAASAGAAAALAGTAAFAFATAATPHHGAVPTAVSPTRARPTGTRSAAGPVTRPPTPPWPRMLAATTTRWSAATNGSQSAAALELATGTSVMAIGGWSGDPTPTLAQFVDDVRAGQITYYVEAGRGGAARPEGPVIRSENHGPSHVREIADWVAAHYPATSIGTSLVYRLSP